MHFRDNHHERVAPLPCCSSFLIVLLVAFMWHSLLIARCSSAPLQSDSASARLPANYQQQQYFPGSQSLPAPSQTALKVLCADTNAEDLRHRLGHAFNERYMAFERPANAIEGPSHLVAFMDRLSGSGQTQAGTRLLFNGVIVSLFSYFFV